MKLFSICKFLILFGLVLVTNLEAAELLYDVNFNADSVGLLPLSGTGPETPTFIISGSGSVTVANSSGDLDEKPVVMKDQAANSLCRIAFRVQPSRSTGAFKISWDGLVTGTMQKGKGATVSVWNEANSKSPIIIEYVENNKIAFAGIDGVRANYSAGVSNHFDLWIDLEAQLVKVYIDGQIIVYSHIFISNPQVRVDNVYMINFDTGVANTSNQEFVLDNIRIEWDPELLMDAAPTSWQLLKRF